MNKTIKRKAHTLVNSISYSGIGLHTGADVTITFFPAPLKTGIIFKRIDLPGKPLIPATIEYIQGTSRSTNVGYDDIYIHTVEHMLAALKAYQIDNLIIEINGIEIPVGNGSSDVFIDLIEKAGVLEQDGDITSYFIREPIYHTDGEIHLVALPSDEYKVSYTLHYPESKAIGSQYIEVDVDIDTFKAEIASCRTFAKYEEVSYLMDQGLIKGGSLDNAVIVKDDVVLSKEGLKFPDEMVRHKVLDLIGDLSLVGYNFIGHIIAIKSGHTSNVAFAKKIFNHIVEIKG